MKNKKFKMRFPDKTATNGIAIIEFDPSFDRVPSTLEYVNTKELALKYWKEVCRNEK